MDVLLVGAELEENLALRYLGAALRRAGHSPRYATFDNPSQTAAVLEQAAQRPYGLVGLSSTFQFRAKEFGRLAEDLRAAGVRAPIVVGGHFPTFAHREMMTEFPAIDYVARHEGESTIVELADGADPASVLGLVWRRRGAGAGDPAGGGEIVVNDARPLAMNLDALPMPDRFGEPQLHLGIPAAFVVGIGP